jgi:type VI secretion system protein ImpM
MTSCDWLERFGWYGKLPAAGDFAHRRLPRDLILWWDRWLQNNLGSLRGSAREGARLGDAAAPIWNFAIGSAAAGGYVQIGCIAPSRDRVGRQYPLCALLYFEPEHYAPSLLEAAPPFFRHMGACMALALRHGCGLEQFDRSLLGAQDAIVAMARSGKPAASLPWAASEDIMAVLGGGHGQNCAALQTDTLGWPDLPRCFNPYSHSSYWWSNQADGAAMQTYLHGGAPNGTLFARLFAPASSMRL